MMSCDFGTAFAKIRFAVAFIGKCVIHVTIKDRMLNLSFGAVFDEACCSCFEVDELLALLEESFQMVKMFAIRGAEPKAFSDLFAAMAKLRIHSMLLFHSSELPPTENVLPFVVDLIEVSPRPDLSPNSVLLPFKNGWTHCYIDDRSSQIIEYLRSLVGQSSASLKLSMRVSDGLDIAWVAGSKIERRL